MSLLGKAALHLHITNFKISHIFIICDMLPDTDILFATDIQREGSFLTYTRNCEQQHNIAVVKSPFKNTT